MDRQYDNRGRDQFNVENARDIHIGIAAAQQRVEVSLKGTIAPKHNPLNWVNRTQPQAELLQRMLTGGGLLEVAGQGRLGKTSLAAWLFAHKKEDFEKALWLDAAWIESFDQLARWVLQELGYLIGSLWDDKALLHELVRRLTQHSCLLVIDHIEQLPQHAIPSFAEFVQYWQEQKGRSFVLVVTCIGWMSDQQFQFELSGLTPVEGEIFLTMQDHLIQEGVENGLQRLVQVAEGHPDLLRLAANWLKLQSNGEVNVSELMFFERLFQNCQGNLVAKVEEVFTELFNQLSERLRSLLLGIAVYRQPFEIEMAQAIQPDSVIADLQWLTEWLFLQEEVGQWVLHPLMRKLIEQRLIESSQFRESHEKAIAYFTSKIKPSKDSIKDCAEELEIFYHYCQLKDYALAEQTINLCAPFLYRRGYNQQLLPFYKQLTQVWKLEHVCDTDDERKLGRAWRRLGALYQCMGEYQDAISSYKLAQTIFSRLSVSEEEAKCIRGIGMVYAAIGEYQRATDFYRQSLGVAYETRNRLEEADSLNCLGHLYLKSGQNQRGIASFQKSLEIVNEIRDCSEDAVCTKADNIHGLGNACYYLGQYQQAIDLYEQSSEIFHELCHRHGEAFSLASLANVYCQLGQYQQAINFYEQSLEIYRELGRQNETANSLSNLGIVYEKLGRYPQAIDLYEQSLKIQQELGDRCGESTTLLRLGGINKSIGQYPQAIDLYEQSLKIQQELGDRRGESVAFSALSAIYTHLAQYQLAIDFNQKALEIQRELGDRYGEAYSLTNLGHVCESLDQHQQSITFYQQSLAMRRELGDRHGEADTLLGLGNAYRSLRREQQAIAYYENSLQIACDIGDLAGKAKALGSLGFAYYQIEQYQQALDFHQQCYSIACEIGDPWLKGVALFAKAQSLAKYEPRRFEAFANFHQARVIFEELNLAHDVEKCDQELRFFNQVIATEQRQSAPNLPTPYY